MLISPTEPKRLRKLGKTSWTPENFGADFLIMAKKERIGIQRKEFPGDFLGSLDDGRLYEQIPKLRDLDKALVILEGHGQWTEDGELIGNQYQSINITQLYGLMFTIMFVFEVPVLWVKSMNETIDVLVTLDTWAKKDKHKSLTSRPGPSKSSWGSHTQAHMAQHILQGFPGIGPELAGRIVKEFEGVPLTWTHSVDELMAVEGLGAKKAKTMYDALEVVSVSGT